MTARVAGRVRSAALAALVLTGVLACERGNPSPPRAAAPLRAPSTRDPRDLDLHLHWRAAEVHQTLRDVDAQWSFRQYSDVIVLGGEAHRSLLLLPSRDGSAATASFPIAVPADGECELVAWVALEPGAGVYSDGVDFAVAFGDADAFDAPAVSGRLDHPDHATEWREVRLDLAPYRGRTLRMTLAARDRGSTSGDWLLWGDPRVRLTSRGTPVAIDLRHSDDGVRRPGTVPWSEVNVFKAYALFNAEEVARRRPDAIAKAIPWARSLRLFSSLGGNWGPTLEREYDRQIGQNASVDSRWERRWAARYEFFRQEPELADRPIAERFTWDEFDRLFDGVAATGLRPHVHLAGVPEPFTGGRGEYPSYHYNELPVVDEAGWKEYVDRVFAHLATRPWFRDAHFSFFSEPNCMWVSSDGSARHLGYQGDAEQYARQYVSTWQAMQRYVGPGQVHFGPWVIEPDPGNPVVDNVREFLRALRREFARRHEALPPWSAFAFNLYETPQLALDGFAEYKIAYVRQLLKDEFPDVELPIRLDEIGVHPLLAIAFERAGAGSLGATRWMVAWQAEMMALLLEERIQQAGPWLSAYDTPAYFAAVALTHAAGGLEYHVSPAGQLRLDETTNADGGEVAVRVAARSAERVGYAWSSRADGSLRAAVWQLPRFATSDPRLAADPLRVPVTLRLPAAADGWDVAVTALDDPELGGETPPQRLKIVGATTTPIELVRRETVVRDTLDVALRPAAVVMIDARPHAR